MKNEVKERKRVQSDEYDLATVRLSKKADKTETLCSIRSYKGINFNW